MIRIIDSVEVKENKLDVKDKIIELATSILESNGYKVFLETESEDSDDSSNESFDIIDEGIFDNKQKKADEYNEAIRKHIKKSLSDITTAAYKAVSGACNAILALSNGENVKRSNGTFSTDSYAGKLHDNIVPLIKEYGNPKAANKGGSILMDIAYDLKPFKQKDSLISSNIEELMKLDKLIDEIKDIEKIGGKAYVHAKEAVNKTVVDYLNNLKDTLHKKYYVK